VNSRDVCPPLALRLPFGAAVISLKRAVERLRPPIPPIFLLPMRRLIANIRRPLNVAAALLVVAAVQHCAWEAGEFMRHLGQASAENHAQGALPVGMPSPGCDNESGCICKGATLAQGLEACLDSQILSNWIALESDPTTGPTVAVVAVPRFSGDDPVPLPPLSGRQLRALLASLLI
jgi:hypothetical protein